MNSENDLEDFNKNEQDDYKNESYEELTIEDIRDQWSLFQQYFEDNKKMFEDWGHKDLISAIRWRIAFSWAEQISEESLKDTARTIKDGSYGPVPEDLVEIQEEMAFNNNDFEDFKKFYKIDKKES